MPIVRRRSVRQALEKKKPVKKGGIVRRFLPDEKRSYADTVEEYVYAIPQEPLPYTELVLRWMLPYQENHFILFGTKLRLTPIYQPTVENKVRISGLLCELLTPDKRNPKKKINGPRGTWHGRIKFFVKSSME